MRRTDILLAAVSGRGTPSWDGRIDIAPLRRLADTVEAFDT